MNGKPDNVHFRGRQKLTSFRALADDPRLQLSKSTLHDAVSLAIQEKRLLANGPIPQGVTVTHRIALLPIHGDDGKANATKLRLLREVADKGLSVRALQQRVKELSGKLLPAASGDGADGSSDKSVRLARPIQALLDLNIERALSERKLAKMRKPHVTQYLRAIEEAMERLKAMKKALDSVGA